MKVSREDLLHVLESVSPGLSDREELEQSTCFAFQGGNVYTFNDHVSCSAPSRLGKELTGAVRAKSLLAILQKMPVDEVDVYAEGNELVLKGKGRRESRLRLEAEVLLPFHLVETPEEWKKVHEDFADGITLVQECALKKSESFVVTCVHIHPKWVEAFDNKQVTRYKMKTGVSSPILVRKDSVRHVPHLGMTEIAETASWVHFRNPDGVTLSCRRYAEEYTDLTEVLKARGDPVQLPKGLENAVDCASVFSEDNAEDKSVWVTLKAESVTVQGIGAVGRYTETRKTSYAGKPVSFSISPKLLLEVTRKHNECEIGKDRLIVDGGKWKYVTVLGVSQNGHDDGGEPEEGSPD